MNAPRLRLLGREHCGLCEEMAAQLAAEFPQLAAVTEHLDVDSREDWRRRYGLRIPVLLDAWDEVICEGGLDLGALEGVLQIFNAKTRRTAKDAKQQE